MALSDWDETQLTPEQEQRYRNSARRMYVPGTKIYDYWHPVIQDECRKMNEEKGLVPFDELPETAQPRMNTNGHE